MPMSQSGLLPGSRPTGCYRVRLIRRAKTTGCDEGKESGPPQKAGPCEKSANLFGAKSLNAGRERFHQVSAASRVIIEGLLAARSIFLGSLLELLLMFPQFAVGVAVGQRHSIAPGLAAVAQLSLPELLLMKELARAPPPASRARDPKQA